MSTTITKGDNRNTLSRIYDRLRKRSYRSNGWRPIRHESYVQGVRDALNAVEADR